MLVVYTQLDKHQLIPSTSSVQDLSTSGWAYVGRISTQNPYSVPDRDTDFILAALKGFNKSRMLRTVEAIAIRLETIPTRNKKLLLAIIGFIGTRDLNKHD